MFILTFASIAIALLQCFNWIYFQKPRHQSHLSIDWRDLYQDISEMDFIQYPKNILHFLKVWFSNSAFSIASACMCCFSTLCIARTSQKILHRISNNKKYCKMLCSFFCWVRSMCVLMKITNRKKGGKATSKIEKQRTNEWTNECLENLCKKSAYKKISLRQQKKAKNINEKSVHKVCSRTKEGLEREWSSSWLVAGFGINK